ncbi:hypothetical protein [Brachybacterium sacelli]|uniref:hypothetical protein n=1 Tax=Brachybacterium sacelli TaxID=173364 RepID=UPI00361410BA
MTRETVFVLTPARWATSRMVAGRVRVMSDLPVLLPRERGTANYVNDVRQSGQGH